MSSTAVHESFVHMVISENEAVEFCIIVWGPLTQAVYVMVETTDSVLALGELVNACDVFDKYPDS